MIPLRTYPTATPQPTAAQQRPDQLEQHQRMQIRAAALRATKLYPGVVGELIAEHLSDWEQFGYVFANGGRVHQLVRHVLDAPLPHPAA